jgi:hypothetical protein
MGDQDPPPAVPFATPKSIKQPVDRSTSNQPATEAPKRDARTAPQDDPPPALPAALAGVLR